MHFEQCNTLEYPSMDPMQEYLYYLLLIVSRLQVHMLALLNSLRDLDNFLQSDLTGVSLPKHVPFQDV